MGPRARSSIQQIENSFIESASSTPTRHGQSFPRINRHITAQGRSGPLPSGKWGEEVCIVLFMSKALKKGQRNYSAMKRELLAIVLAISCRGIFGRSPAFARYQQILTNKKINRVLFFFA